MSRNRTLLLVAALFMSAVVLVPSAGASSPGDSVITGRYSLRHGDDFAAGTDHPLAPVLELDDGTVRPLHFGATGSSIAPGSRIRVRGTRSSDGGIEVADGGTQTLSTSTTASATATGARKVAIVLINFSNDTSQPYTPATAAGVAFTNANSVAAYYATVSWGQLKLSGDVFGWYTITDSDASCNPSTWANDAAKVASAAGIDLTSYDNVVWAFPSVSACSWAGLADMPGRNSWLNGPMAMGIHTMAHELGHNFGTNHASELDCTHNGVRVSLSATSSDCTTQEYGDPFSVMGMATHYEHTNFARGNFGWLTPANTVTATTSGSYTLAPVESYLPNSVQTIRIPRTSNSYLTLEFRQPDGSLFDSFSPTNAAVTGVTIRITPDYGTLGKSQLVDANPATTTFSDAALAVGETLVDPLTGISISTVGVSPVGATVCISFGDGGCSTTTAPPVTTTDTTPPSQPAGFTAAAVDQTDISLSWTASSDNVGVTGYRIYRSGALLTTVSAPGYADAGLTAATAYTYQVIAYDAAGNASTAATATATTPAPPPAASDTTAPTAPGNLTASAAKGKKVALSWAASTDNIGVSGYSVYRDGSLVGTTTGTGYTDALGGKASSATYYVVAYDAAGNVSPASNTATAQL
jgi:chitodextrinase